MGTSSVRRRLVLVPSLVAPLAAVLASGVGTGCTKKSNTPIEGPNGGDPVVAAPVVELAPVELASQMLPRDTALLVTIAGIDRVAEVFERDRLVEAFSAQYLGIKAMMVGAIGHDLLDPAVWPQVGLDPAGPISVSVSDPVAARMVVFAKVSDRTKLVSFIREVAGKGKVEMVEKAYGDALVLRTKDSGDLSVVLRDDFVALVPGRGEDDFDMAERVVTMDPNVSLATDVGYRKATGGLREADVTLFVDVAAMVDQLNMEQESRVSAPESNWALEELERAQKQGAPQEELDRLAEQAERVRADQARWRAESAAERALAELLVSGIDGVGATATVKRSGPIYDGRIVAGEEAFLRRLLVNRQGAPILTTAMKGEPLQCLGGAVDVPTMLELVGAMGAADGEDWTALAQAELGLTLAEELPTALAGTAELCLALDGELDLKADKPSEQLGMGIVVQTTNEAKAKYLLAKVASSSGTLGKRMRKKGEGYVMPLPDWKPLHLQAVGNRIVIGTDPELAQRVAESKPGSMPSKIRPVAARGAINLPDTAFSYTFDTSMGMVWLLAGRAEFGEPVIAAPGMSPEELAKVPHSAKSKKARKAMQKAQAALGELERERDQKQLDGMLKMTDPLGLGVVAATEDERGFTLVGGQFVRAESMGAMVEHFIEGMTSLESERGAGSVEGLDEAWKRFSETQQAYIDARLEDAERALAKRKR